MPQIYPWPLKFFNKGREYHPLKNRTSTGANKNSLFRMEKMALRSSSKMLRSIDQKIRVVKSSMFITTKGLTASADMFTPIVTSFNPLSKQIISRYIKPKIIDLTHYPSKNPRFVSHKKFKQLPRREITECVVIDSGPHLNLAKKFVVSRYKPRPKRRLGDPKRPSSAPTKSRLIKPAESCNIKNSGITKRANSEIKSLECSKKLNNIDSITPIKIKGEKTSKMVKKCNKKQINSRICIEGVPDTISVKCNSKMLQEINPQLFGSLSSSNFPSSKLFKESFGFPKFKNNLTKRISKQNGSKFDNTPSDNRRMRCFISKIPEQSLTRLKRRPKKDAFDHNLDTNSLYCRNRDLYCKSNVILEENAEVEMIDEKIYNNEDSSRNLAKRKNEEIKQKFLDIFIEEKSKHNMEDIDNARLKGDEIEIPPKSVESTDCNHHSKKLPKSNPSEVSTRYNNENDADIEKEFHKSLRRSFFTLSLEKSQNNSSVYETCNTRFSGENLVLNNFSNGRKPPPPSPIDIENNGGGGENSEKEEKKSAGEYIDEDTHSFLVNDELSNNMNATTVENFQNSSTLARISGKLSTEGRSDVFQISQLSSDEDCGKDAEYDGNFSNSFIEQLCEVDGSKFNSPTIKFIPIQEKVEKIMSISDTYIDEASSCNFIEQEYQEGFVYDTRKLKRRKPEGRWKSVPSLRVKNCSSNSSIVSCKKNSTTLSSASNIISINSNMELLSEDSHFSNSTKKSFEKSERSHAFGNSNTSNISNLLVSPSELLEESKIALEKLMKRLNRPNAVYRRDDSLNDILKDLSELDHDDTFKRMCNDRIELNCTSTEVSTNYFPTFF